MKLLYSSISLACLAGLGVSLARLESAPSPARAVEVYGIDPVHSFVVFHTRHVGISQAYGRFDRISDKSSLDFDAKDPSQSTISIVIDASSVNTNNQDRDKHLMSPDFFSAKEFPEIVFESKKVSAKGDDWEITGDLTLHGVTKSITAKAELLGQGDVAMSKDYRIGLLTEFRIDMRDFGFDFVKKNPGAVGPEVTVTVSLECPKKK